ncbi:MAG: DUF4175 domain-containing protein [Parvularcula sp.]
MMPPRLKRLMMLARLTLWWERAYAIAAPIGAVVLVWAGLSLLGVWQIVPPWGQAVFLIGLVALGVAVGVLARRRLRHIPAETPRRRIEADSALPPGYLRDLGDRPISGNNALWQRHQSRLQDASDGARLRAPRALIDRTDPFMLRLGAVLFLGLGLVIAGRDGLSRLKAGAFPAFGTRTVLIADAWIDPPAYTNTPPTFLLRSEPMTTIRAASVRVPSGSVFHAQLTRPDGKKVRLQARIATDEGTTRLTPEPTPGRSAISATLTTNAALELRSGGRVIIWPLETIPDAPPAVEWADDPSIIAGSRLLLPVTTSDDYGVTKASLLLTLADDLTRPPDAPRPDPDIVRTPQILPIPALHGRGGERSVEIDLTENPWAGLPVKITMLVQDGAGQEARTTSREITLPVRTFYNPLARAVLEQRQSLALAPSSWKRSARTFDALTFAPDRFARSGREFLLVRSAYHQVFGRAATDVTNVVDSLWPLALSLEDEGLMRARERLEAAKAALREALARGASQSEIDALIEEMREAMAEYLAALAQSEDAPMASGDADMEGRDLQDILDEIAELRRMGDTEEARRRLAELEQLLDNIQLTEGPSSGDGQGRAGGSPRGGGDQSGNGEGDSLGAATDLIQRQRELADDTFSVQRGDRFGADLAPRQGELADQLAELRAEAEQPDGAEDALGEAEQAMREAATALEDGDLGLANDFQEQAIEALREGGRAMAEAQRQDRGGDENGSQRSSTERRVTEGAGEGRDPLGRSYTRLDSLADEVLGASDPERIRELTERLRKALSDPTLNEAQRAYLERLLQRF